MLRPKSGPGDAIRAAVLNARLAIWAMRSQRLLGRYRKRNARPDIERAIQLLLRGRDAAPPGTFTRALLARALGEALELLSRRTDDQDALAEALLAVRDAVATIAAHDPSRPMFVRALIDLLTERFAGDPDALREAAALGRQLIDEALPGDRDLGRLYELLGAALSSLYLLTSDPATLAEALHTARTAIAVASTGQGDAVAVSVAAGQLHDLFTVTGDADALLDAVTAGRAAVAMARKRRDTTICLNNLATALSDLAQVQNDLSLLGEAVQVARDALAVTPAGDPARATILCNLGIALRCRSETTGDPETLIAAAAAGREAIAATPAADPMLPVRLAMLQATLVQLLRTAGDPAVLREAAQVGHALTAAVTAGHPDQAQVLLNHAAAVREMATWTGDRALHLEAVEAARQAVAAAPPGHSMRGMALVGLGQALRFLGKHDANLTVATEAARILRDAAVITPPGHHERSDVLSPLGLALLDMWELTGDRGALTEAIEAGRAAVAAATSAEGYRRAKYLSNLGISLLQLYYASADQLLGDEVVQMFRAAVTACPQGDPIRAAYLSNLCLALHQVSLSQDSPAAASEAVQAGREAMTVMPAGYPDRPGHLAVLGRALMSLAQQTGSEKLAREAVQVAREAVTAAREEDISAGVVLGMLGTNLHALFELAGDPRALTEARHVLAETSGSSALTPRERMVVLRQLARAEMTAGNGPGALDACERAVELLPLLAARSLCRADREHALGSIFQFPAEAAASATAAGVPERAVELLEQTRGLLIGEAIDADGTMAGLRSLAPDLAAQFGRLRDRLDAVDCAVPEPQYRAGADERVRLAHEWDALLVAIRKVPGLEDFMRPRDIARLAEQADEGPVVLVYSTEHRSDALILRAGSQPPVRVVPLVNVTRGDVSEYNGRVAAAMEAVTVGPLAERRHAEREIGDVLAWLWDRVTGPVLESLGIRESPGADAAWPRVWWCPVGDLAFLPLHAAGQHVTGTRDTSELSAGVAVLDRVISSYTPTIRALEHARHREASRRDGSAGALIVAMPETPAANPLPSAAVEAEHVAQLVPGSLVLTGRQATSAAVQAAITGYQVAHFACHGVSDSQDPGSSMLLLHDHESQPLTVTALSRLRLRNAALAFLSACSTAKSSERLADEMVHITAAFQLAGYSRVIGTLWPIRDTVAADLCEEVFRLLTRDGTSPVHLDESACAVHAATRNLRGRFPASPSVWAGFVHFGA